MTGFVQKRIDIVTAQRRLGLFAQRANPAVVRVLNRLATTVRLEGSKRIRGKLALPATYVRERLNIRPATLARPEAVIFAKRRGVLLSRFKWRQLFERNTSKPGRKRAGVAGVIVPGRQYRVRKFFVIPQLNNGNGPGIAIRTGKGRDAFEVLHAPSVSQAFAWVRDDLSEEYSDRARKNVEYELARLANLGAKVR